MEIEDAIKSGERNRDTMTLVRNWCANARLKKAGGIGMVEQMTGLPIGLHMIECDFAPMGGFASGDLRHSAIDFYDRNCVSCVHRKPVGLPNIAALIAERDQAAAARDAEAAEIRRVADEALAARSATRDLLKPLLSAIGGAIVEDIDAFDRDRSKVNFDRVAQSAKLAPEAFEPPLVEYICALAEQEWWFAELAMTVLPALGADDARLARLAVGSLERMLHPAVAAATLVPRLSHVTEEAVASTLRTAINLAYYDHTDVVLGDDAERPQNNPALLAALYDAFPDTVRGALEQMLLSGKRYTVETAGRGLIVLLDHDTAAAESILRTVVSAYLRADTLIGDLKRDGDRLPHYADALNDAFAHSPAAVDAIIQQLLEGATLAVRQRAIKVYKLAMHVRWDNDAPPATSERHRIALRRLLWTATTERDEDCSQEIAGAFRSGDEKLRNVVRAEFDAVIGALLLLADRLAEIDNERRSPDENWMDVVGRRTRRSHIVSLQGSLVDWAAEAAIGDEALIRKLVGLFDELPEDRDELRGLLIGSSKKLSGDLAGLLLVLPHLYHALVGPSALIRSYAATAVGELPYRAHENVPELVFEAFGVLLTDPYTIVHKAALRAFRFGFIPEQRPWSAGEAILNLIHYYRTQADEDAFVADCIEVAAGMIEAFGAVRNQVRRYLVESALAIDPLYLSNEISRLRHALGEEPDFALLVARMIPQLADSYNSDDEIVRLLDALPAASIKRHYEALGAAAADVVHDDFFAALAIVEALGRAGAAVEATALADSLTALFDDTKRNAVRRTALQRPALMLRFEAAVAAGDAAAIEEVAARWREAEAADEDNRRDNDERRNRSSLSSAD